MRNKLIALAVVSGMAVTGCATNPSTGENRLNKAGIGALAGAAGGAAISKATGGDKTGRDAAIGGLLGAGVGAYMERQARQLEQQMAGSGVTVKPDANGNIGLVMPGNITFSFDSAALSPSFTPTLDKVARTLNDYSQGNNIIVVSGHTDSRGDDNYNMNLSRDRANSVASYLINRGVAPNRIQVIPYGESRPIASNNTDAGRQQNRRVELTINAPNSVR